MFELFVKGCLIGFSIAMPVGPIGLLCIRHSLISGAFAGVIVGLGAASADALYGALAGFGITAVAHFFAAYGQYVQWLGAAFLCYLGIATFFAGRREAREDSGDIKGYRLYLTTFVLTLTNPMTILSFVAIYAGLGLRGESNGLVLALATTVGVFAGSTIWWLLLSSAAALFRHKISVHTAIWLNRISGMAILGFGLTLMRTVAI
ncbi:MAG: LysE family translocator [Parachlamydia sp.]|nr:LysE family translocator [Parachlamydia sp.]